jgi:predicted ArsR family transcriptional regulator
MLYTFVLCKIRSIDLPIDSEELRQPTRRRIFSVLVELRRSASSEELAERTGLHVNGVRRHLERLAGAGLVDRQRVSAGRGRPRDEWSIAQRATPGGRRPSAYSDLARWLARAIGAGPARLREIEREGREIGRSLAPVDSDGLATAGFEEIFTALGFQPELEEAAGEVSRCRLCNCPYRDSVRENPELVCTLHRGITAGVLDVLAPNARLVAFEPRDPERAGCLVEVAGAQLGSRTSAE